MSHTELMDTYRLPAASEPVAELLCADYANVWRPSGRPVPPYAAERIHVVDALNVTSRPYMQRRLEGLGYDDDERVRTGFANVCLTQAYLELMREQTGNEEGGARLKDLGVNSIELSAALQLTHTQDPSKDYRYSYRLHGQKILEHAKQLEADDFFVNPFEAPVMIGKIASDTRIDPAPAGSPNSMRIRDQTRLGDQLSEVLGITKWQNESINITVDNMRVIRNRQIATYADQYQAHVRDAS